METGIVQRPARGQTVCGDSFRLIEGDGLTVAVADGLGHGPPAAEASVAFCDYVERHADEGLQRIMDGATRAIRATRGAAAALLRFDPDYRGLDFVGVGNIELQAVSQSPIRPVCAPGIVGRSLRKILQFTYELAPGDLIAVYSDGLSSRLQLANYKRLEPQGIAERLLEEHGKHHDDATCLVFRI